MNPLEPMPEVGMLYGPRRMNRREIDVLRGLTGEQTVAGRRAFISLHRNIASPSHETKIIASVVAQKLISSLTPRQRQVIELKFMAGMTEPEIGKFLRVPTHSISARRWDAINKMRKLAQ